VEHEWRDLAWTHSACPVCAATLLPLYRLIPHLNDDHRWTRERIADFVAAIEAKRAVDQHEIAQELRPVDG
jgi:hypothetical protein